MLDVTYTINMGVRQFLANVAHVLVEEKQTIIVNDKQIDAMRETVRMHTPSVWIHPCDEAGNQKDHFEPMDILLSCQPHNTLFIVTADAQFRQVFVRLGYDMYARPNLDYVNRNITEPLIRNRVVSAFDKGVRGYISSFPNVLEKTREV